MFEGLDVGTAFMVVVAIGLIGTIALRCPQNFAEMFLHLKDQASMMAVRVPLALLAASFISQLIPTEVIGRLIGAESGTRGMLLSCLLGGLVPGGPMISFPIALVIWQMGAGEAQMIAFLAAWSIFAVHRIISYELPIMGGRFVVVRLVSSWMLPPLAGAIAMIWLAFSGSF
jgi:uncharacterized membrane protein YraQ (UPF0718 family)